MAKGVARVLKWLRMQRDLIELKMTNWRDQLESANDGLRRAEKWLEQAVDRTDRNVSQLHVVTVLQQRAVLDDQCQLWRERVKKVQHEIELLLAERDRIRMEMRKFEVLLDEERQHEKRRASIRMEQQLEDFVLRQWGRGFTNREIEPC